MEQQWVYLSLDIHPLTIAIDRFLSVILKMILMCEGILSLVLLIKLIRLVDGTSVPVLQTVSLLLVVYAFDFAPDLKICVVSSSNVKQIHKLSFAFKYYGLF